MSLHGRVSMSVSSSEAVQQIDTLGRYHYEDYIGGGIGTRNLQTPIKKNTLGFFSNRSSDAKQQLHRSYVIVWLVVCIIAHMSRRTKSLL